jgi:hypothetical protein
VDLLAQDVSDRTGTVGPGSADRYCVGHESYANRARDTVRVADDGPQRQVSVLRRARFGEVQPEPGPGGYCATPGEARSFRSR